MTLLINIVFVLIIVSYVAFVLRRYMRKSKQGQFSACDVNDGCTSHTISKPNIKGSILLTVGEKFTNRYFRFKYKNSTNISIIV
ncbi:hypothetical protein MTR10_08345, partial [Staphylococcus agnetis]